jgi:hypothetical protein
VDQIPGASEAPQALLRGSVILGTRAAVVGAVVGVRRPARDGGQGRVARAPAQG